MSSTAHVERGGLSTLRATKTANPNPNRPRISPFTQQNRSTTSTAVSEHRDISHPSTTEIENHALDLANSSQSQSATLDFPTSDSLHPTELLKETVFPDWKDDAGGDVLESPEELQKKDPLGTQIWKLYSRTKTRLPNQERMENLTWRMMAMNLRRREREQQQAMYVALVLERFSCLSHSLL